MADLLCPFSGPQIKQDFACQHAEEIIRRGGTEIACQHVASHALCATLHEAIKQSALQNMDYEDDLTQVPHNVLLKIQYGGLLGLQALMDESASKETVADIANLVAAASVKYDGTNNLPLAELNQVIVDYKTKRRSRR